MEVFGIVGMSMGTLGFIFALSASAQVQKLEKQLKVAGVLPKQPHGDKAQ